MSRYDVAVVGAGPAGCSTAIFLARAGLHVALLDKAAFPRPKACGEGIMPSGAEVLMELNILGKVSSSGRCFEGIRFTTPSGISASGRFPGGKMGVALPRERLDEILFETASAISGIKALEGCRDLAPRLEDGKLSAVTYSQDTRTQKLEAAFFVIADGAASRTLRQMNIARREPPRRRFGLSAHFDRVAPDRYVNVFLFRAGEAYLAAQAHGTALVSFLVEHERLPDSGGAATLFETVCRGSEPFSARVHRASQISPWIGFGPLGGSSARWNGPGWLAAGDSASSVDPITGDGIALALRDGRSAAAHLLNAFGGACSFSAAAARYSRERRERVGRKGRRAAVLLEISRRPALAGAVIRSLRTAPALFSSLLSDC